MHLVDGPARSTRLVSRRISPICAHHEGASIFELARTQGVAPVESLKELQDDTITAAEAEAFMAALGL